MSEREKKQSNDLLFESTPENHPQALLLVNKEYAKNLLMNEESFEFLKKSYDIKIMNGVTLHLAFANPDLISEILKVAQPKMIDGIPGKSISHQLLIVKQNAQEKKYKDDKLILRKALSIYN